MRGTSSTNTQWSKYDFALFIPVITGVVVIAFQVICSLCFIIKGVFSEADAIFSLLNVGLSLIGLAISVWVGLNIANAIERRELNNTTNKIAELNTEYSKLKSTIMSVKQNYIQQIAYNFASNNDFYHRVLSAKIMEKSTEELSDLELDNLNLEFFMQMSQLVLAIGQIKTLHEKGDCSTVITLAKNAILNIKGLQAKYNQLVQRRKCIMQS